MVFLSMTKMPNTVKPIGSPQRRLNSTFSCQQSSSHVFKPHM